MEVEDMPRIAKVRYYPNGLMLIAREGEEIRPKDSRADKMAESEYVRKDLFDQVVQENKRLRENQPK